MRQNNFDGKSWYPPPLLSLTFFETRDFPKHRKVPRRTFSALWDKKFSTENLDTPPSPLIHKLFRYRKLSETQHRRVHLQNFSALWDKKFSTENLDTPPSPLIHKLFRYRKFSETHRRMFQLRNFSAMWDKNFRRKILILHPPPSYPYTFSLPEIFWNTPPKGSSTKCFGTVRQKIFDRKSWHSPSPLIHKLFRCRKLSETQHRRVHLQNFSALWNKKLSTENLDTPPSPFLSIHFFAAGNFLKHSTEGFTYKFFGTVRQKIFDGKSWYSPLPSYP